MFNLSSSIGDINIFQASSFHILLQTRFGLQIQVQHVPVMQVYISLEQSYKAKTQGRFHICPVECGIFKENDYCMQQIYLHA